MGYINHLFRILLFNISQSNFIYLDSRWSSSRTTSSRGGGLHSAESGERDEVRAALLRHWTSLDRARLHTFHLWLFVYALAQIFLFHYLCHRSFPPNPQLIPILFQGLVLGLFVFLPPFSGTCPSLICAHSILWR